MYRDILFLSLVALGKDNIDIGESEFNLQFVSVSELNIKFILFLMDSLTDPDYLGRFSKEPIINS